MAEIEKSVLGSVRLDSDIWEAVRAMPCSLNLYLRENLLGGGKPARKLTRKEKLIAELEAIDPVGAARSDVELGNFELPRGGSVSQGRQLDATGPLASSGRGKATLETRKPDAYRARGIRPKGDKGR